MREHPAASSSKLPCVRHTSLDRFETCASCRITTTTTARTKTEQKKLFLLVGRSPSSPQSKRKREIGLIFSVQIVFYYLFKCWDTLSFLSNVASEDAPQQSCQCVHGTENQ